MTREQRRYCCDLRLAVSSVIAGLLIGVGGMAYLSCESPVVGSLLFCLGLFTICVFGLDLFTGKCGYLLCDTRPGLYAVRVAVIWLGNLAGTGLAGWAARASRPALMQKAAALCQNKLALPPLTVLLLGIFCGLLMYIAVHNFKTNDSPLGRYLGIFLCVPVFILSGFEHSVADMFYFWLAGGVSLPFLLLVTAGNLLGSFLLPLYDLIKKADI